MKSFVTLLFAVLFLCPYLYPQTINYSLLINAGGNGNDLGNALCVDESGNIYITGEFNSSPAIFGSDISLTTFGNVDFYIAKYNSAGNIIWAKQGGSGLTDRGFGVVADGSNIYCAGHFYGKSKFDSITVTATGNLDSFLAKYDTSGNIQWLKQGRSTSQVSINGISLDSSKNIVAIGYFGSKSDTTVNFNNVKLISSGNRDIFLVKYNDSGNVLWAKSAGGVGLSDEGESLSIDNADNIYIAGEFKDSASFDNIKVYSNGGIDAFIAKYNSDGDVIWVKHGGGKGSDYAKSIAFVDEDNLYVTGYFDSSATFSGIDITGNDFSDIFIAKYNSNGDLQWIREAASPHVDYGSGITANSSGCFVTGKFMGTITFGTIDLTSINGSEDIFIAKYDPSGNIQFVKQMGGSGKDYGNAITLDKSDNIYITGFFESTANFDDSFLVSNGGEDIFIAKLDNTSVPVELITFNATVQDNSVILNWNTATETNNFQYIIERSSDKVNFSEVGSVNGKGTTSEKQSYSFIDKNLSSGEYYYRLKQVDFDGSFSYSRIVSSEVTVIREFVLHQNYPNPFNPSTTISFGLPTEAVVNISVFNVIGQEISTPLINKQYSAGVYQINFDAHSFTSGIYFYKINAKTINGLIYSQTRKMNLLK